uniref:C2H2-type domain-containing protein n=1 Tax=Anopheles melas TaxID=34690 RepID=A0A182THW7_9DIPT
MVHLGIRPHTCPLCTKSYSQYSNLKKHLLSHQKQAIKQEQQNGQVMAILYSCQTCKMQFEDIIEFERHTRRACKGPALRPPPGTVVVDPAAIGPAPAGVVSLLPNAAACLPSTSVSASPMVLPFVVKAEKPDEEIGGV